MIMKGKWKTRAMAFVMAFSMGMSSMISSSVYAAAEQPETKVETETQVFEEQTEEKVRAEDIVKDVSDKEFRVETSMEGISYDPERESVLLSEIKDQDGGSFQPENPGVYYAQYLVTPKDGSEPYMIGRTITLTDTEGLAHSESNGGEKQKEDTSSEEESEQPLPVEITSSQPEDTPDVLAELERDIEEGNVMMFSAADGMGKSETVHLNKGRTIYYPDYLGNYLTCLFTVNGKLAYCLESHRASPPTGDYVADILEKVSDMKYDKIVEISKERSKQYTKIAFGAIEEMLREGEWITTAQLMRKTKLSKAIFYRNKDVRRMLEDARYRQQCMLKTNLDSVIEIENLQEKLRKVNLQVIKLKSEKQELSAMNKELQRKIEVMKLQ